jgi:hypothetical protein
MIPHAISRSAKRPAMPPTTPPTIAPVFDEEDWLLSPEEGLEPVVTVAPDGMMDCVVKTVVNAWPLEVSL